MKERHWGHRAEIQRGEVGLGEHFNAHMVENGWDIDKVVEYLDLTIIGSVEEGRHDSKKHLNNLETNFQNRLMTMQKHGGLNHSSTQSLYIDSREKGSPEIRQDVLG